MLEYLKPFDSANKLALTHIKIRLPTNHMYNHLTVTQLAGAIEYTDYISAEE